LARGRVAIPDWDAWRSMFRLGQIWTFWTIWLDLDNPDRYRSMSCYSVIDEFRDSTPFLGYELRRAWVRRVRAAEGGLGGGRDRRLARRC